MTTFTNTLPTADAFGVEANYVVIHPERGEIWSPCSSRQITDERFGFAARGGYLWAKRSPDMARAIASPPERTDEALKRHEEVIIAYGHRIQEARKLAVAAQDAVEKVWRALA